MRGRMEKRARGDCRRYSDRQVKNENALISEGAGPEMRSQGM